jgi:hypothetical protein
MSNRQALTFGLAAIVVMAALVVAAAVALSRFSYLQG